ncbi:MAG: Rha family transcriptional regulator [Clostridia bacterium]|nr:Rha family transcriptional regulator [Clostridia bacterium]
MKPKKLTPFGVEVKKRLLDMQMSQREFCEEHDIPENRFSEILYGTVSGKKHREKIAKALGIKISA